MPIDPHFGVRLFGCSIVRLFPRPPTPGLRLPTPGLRPPTSDHQSPATEAGPREKQRKGGQEKELVPFNVAPLQCLLEVLRQDLAETLAVECAQGRAGGAGGADRHVGTARDLGDPVQCFVVETGHDLAPIVPRKGALALCIWNPRAALIPQTHRENRDAALGSLFGQRNRPPAQVLPVRYQDDGLVVAVGGLKRGDGLGNRIPDIGFTPRRGIDRNAIECVFEVGVVGRQGAHQDRLVTERYQGGAVTLQVVNQVDQVHLGAPQPVGVDVGRQHRT